MTKLGADVRLDHAPVGPTARTNGESGRDPDAHRQVRTLVDQLAAIRLDLLYGVMPRAERITLTGGDLELVVRQLDGAIVTTKAIIAELESWTRDATRHRTRNEYRESPGNKRKETA